VINVGGQVMETTSC